MSKLSEEELVALSSSVDLEVRELVGRRIMAEALRSDLSIEESVERFAAIVGGAIAAAARLAWAARADGETVADVAGEIAEQVMTFLEALPQEPDEEGEA